jgi:multiple sugar transport system ATP-binding protein
VANVLFKGVKKRYGDVEVIAHLDLEIRAGEFMVLVGPSGCGKSTALRMIAGLEEITAGQILIGDRVVNDLPPKDRNIAMVFQNYALYPHMTVRENIDFGLRMQKVGRPEIDRRVGEAARILGIEELLQRKPRALSGGQRQRVAVGRAIVRQPGVFLFDEPLSNLDAKLRVQMRAEITTLQRRLGTTTVYVTHDQVEAMTMGHRIAVLDAGDLQQVGTPMDVYAAPANVFVARFIGTPPMNFVPGTLSPDADRVAGAGFEFPLAGPARVAAAGRGGARVLVGLRPEHLTDRPTAGSGPTATVRVTVESAETLGHEILVHARLGSEVVVAKVDPHNRPDLAQEIDLQVSCGHVRLFDADGGRALSAAD